MAIEDVVPVDHYSNHPHGTQVKDSLAPSGDGTQTDGVFVGYPDTVTVEAPEGSFVWGASNIVIVDGKPVHDGNSEWIQLGIVGSTGYLRLKRVRYALLDCTTDGTAATGAPFTVHTGELNVIEDVPYVTGLDL